MNGRVLHFVPNADLRCSHQGLSDIAKEELGVSTSDLKIGEFVIFVNGSWTQLKAYCSNNIVLHYKKADGSRLNAKAVMQLPRFIRGQDIGYKEALTEVIEAEYSARYPIASKHEH